MRPYTVVLVLVGLGGCLLGRSGPPDLIVQSPFVDRADAPIPDQGTVRRTLAVTTTGSIVRATAEVIIQHARPADVRVTLTSPRGTAVPIEARLAERNDYGRYAIPLLALQGEPASGPWRLTVEDTAAGVTGTLATWAVAFEAVGP